MSRSHDSDSVRRLINRLRVCLKVLSRYLAFPLRLVRHLCRTLLRLYHNPRTSVASRRRFQCIHTDGHPERVAGSSQPTMLLPPSNHQPQNPPLPVPASCSSGSLFPVHAPPSSSNCVLQSPPAAPTISESQSITTFEPFVPFDVMRYDKNPSINPDVNKYKFIDPLTRDFLE
ncbi:hypothetical protein BDR05DRAFT_288838 [Suillus weaverae]|nr:hypothetical protein BDR05DRAFT_288838 [Suillus weaverae]